MYSALNRVFSGGKSGSARRYLGHTQNAVNILGSTVNSMNRLGYTSSPIHKAHHYATKYVMPFVDTAQKVLA